ncbi:MAG TPA: ThiF family adenylyltransferase [Planctomycetaceae bacterium]|jgi:molybdopterin/thiamine biosynthesis adenylyltransferase|nr:ThiF family adenylyltransferase [Planctomycetaceae bacterium]
MDLERYSKQVLFTEIGEAGQRKLLAGRAVLLGCGALGSVLAETLVRAGVGHLRIVDRDFVELSNLQRQVLFDESDVAERLPKAVAAAAKLRRINSSVSIEPVVVDVEHTNVLSLIEGFNLILDGSDNFELRFLINDASLDTGIPWLYAGVIGSHGQVMPIFPNQSACLRCLIERVPDAGSTETCDTAGVLGPAVQVVASLEAVAALKFLSGQPEKVARTLSYVDVWDGTLRQLNVADLREKSDCPACKHGERLWLSGEMGSRTSVLCGRNAVQVSPTERGELVLEDLAARLTSAGEVQFNDYLLRLSPHGSPFELTVFRDGRAIIKGTDDLGIARGVYSRYVGS